MSFNHADRRLLPIFILLLVLVQRAPVVAQNGGTNELQQVESELTKDEHALADAERKHDTGIFQRLLRDDLIYVAFNGWVFTKKELVSKMHYIDVDKYSPQNVKVRLPANDIALITYDLKARASIAGHDFPAKQYVSSLWVKHAGAWQLLLHQATPATHP